jgi:hypothetical protein
MQSFISKKLSFVLLLCSYCTTFLIVFLLNYTLGGPKLGLLYDTLRGFRDSRPVSTEILLIETDELIEPSDVFSVLMTMSEMGASNLLIEVPLLGTGSVIAETGLEFSYRINDEFGLVGRNIRNLFEAIRLGLVPPVEASDYVERLVKLTEQGRDRLNAAIIRQDEAGSVLAAQAAKVFGRAITAEALRPASTGDISWYSRPRPDNDGILRRIAPVEEVEHIVYYALMPRWEKTTINLTKTGLFLVNNFASQGEPVEQRFPLDRNGNILIEKQTRSDFRRLNLSHFRNSDQTGKTLARLLKEAESLGVYAKTTPERIPLILFDYAESLKEELLKNPSESKQAAWINARAKYIAALDDFLYGPAEMILVNGYEELIATENIGAKGIARLRELRDELIRAFVAMREQHRELVELRTLLTKEINSSFCIMGPASSGGMAAGRTDIPETSALLANTLLTGHCITPGQSLYIILWSSIASFIVLAGIYMAGPVLLLTMGFAGSLICGAAFGISFIISGYWIDPFIPMTACFGGTLVLAVSRFCIGYGRMLRFRIAYTGLVNNKMLKLLVKAGRPSLSETLCVHAAIIAVKKPSTFDRGNRESALEAAAAAAVFRQEFSSIFRRYGALILGFENNSALACFGSPPERICRKERKNPDAQAVQCVKEIANNAISAEWHFGIASGECVFSWSAETGYTVNGDPVVHAGIFASLTQRYNARALIGNSVMERSGLLRLQKLASLSGENFYELPVHHV